MIRPEDPPAAVWPVRSLRRAAVITVIVALSVTAAVGILTLVTGAFGDVQWRVMSTTGIIGALGVYSLCHLAVLGGRFRVVGVAGLIVSAIAVVIGLVLTWAPYDALGAAQAQLWRWFGITAVIATSAAHANLLLLLAGRRNRVVRVCLWVTIGLIALLCVLVILLLLTDGRIGTVEYGRLIGAVAILDVLGTILVPVLALFLRHSEPVNAGATARSAVPQDAEVRLPSATLEQLDALAAAAGLTREQLLAALVRDAYADQWRRRDAR